MTSICKMLSLGTAIMLMLSACASPVTHSPVGSAQEVQQEASYQTGYVKQQQKTDIKALGDLSESAVLPRVQAIAARITPAATQLCRELRINDAQNCTYPVGITPGQKNAKGVVEPDTSLNAFADGKGVYVSPAMVHFAANDNDLAFIIAHEFAHNIMRHVDGKVQNALLGTLLGVAADVVATSQGFNTQGQFSKLGMGIGANAYSPAFETEADYIGLYLLARAGYDYHNAPHFWRKMSVENPQAIYTGQTHPSNAQRFVNMNKTIAEIDHKLATQQPLLPEFRKGN